MKFKSSIFRLALIMLLPAYSDVCADKNVLSRLVSDISGDCRSVATAPFHWQAKDGLLAVSFLSATSVAFATDERSADFFQDNRTTFSNRTADFFRPWGDGLALGSLAGFYAAGLALKDPRAKETAYMGLRAILISGAVTTSLKYGFGRARPFANTGAYHFEGFDFTPASYSLSLPSGHTTTAFALAAVLSSQYPKWWVRALALGTATAVAWSRTNDNVHFLSDVVVGGGIGFFVGKKIANRHKARPALESE